MAQKKNPSARGDITGRQKAADEKKAQKEQAKRAEELSMITAQAEKAKKTEVVDLTAPKPEVKPDPDYVELDGSEGANEPGTGASAQAVSEVEVQTQVEVQPVTVVKNDKVKIRAKYDLDDVTVGYGTSYTFEEGRKYIVPRNVAVHLSEIDVVEILA